MKKSLVYFLLFLFALSLFPMLNAKFDSTWEHWLYNGLIIYSLCVWGVLFFCSFFGVWSLICMTCEYLFRLYPPKMTFHEWSDDIKQFPKICILAGGAIWLIFMLIVFIVKWSSLWKWRIVEKKKRAWMEALFFGL